VLPNRSELAHTRTKIKGNKEKWISKILRFFRFNAFHLAGIRSKLADKLNLCFDVLTINHSSFHMYLGRASYKASTILGAREPSNLLGSRNCLQSLMLYVVGLC
jgi:hypothetical protein